jgi:hypothetical protein
MESSVAADSPRVDIVEFATAALQVGYALDRYAAERGPESREQDAAFLDARRATMDEVRSLMSQVSDDLMRGGINTSTGVRFHTAEQRVNGIDRALLRRLSRVILPKEWTATRPGGSVAGLDGVDPSVVTGFRQLVRVKDGVSTLAAVAQIGHVNFGDSLRATVDDACGHLADAIVHVRHLDGEPREQLEGASSAFAPLMADRHVRQAADLVQQHELPTVDLGWIPFADELFSLRK